MVQTPSHYLLILPTVLELISENAVLAVLTNKFG